jgi:hypothetical protein
VKFCQKNLQNVNNWLIENKLFLHIGKTESIVFGSKSKLSKSKTLDIMLDGNKIKQSSFVKYLGVILNNNMDMSLMFDNVYKRVNSTLKFLFRNKSLCNMPTRKILAMALVQPLIDYGVTSWYNCLTQLQKNKLQICQNKLIKYVLSKPNRSHLHFKDFQTLNWLNIENRVNYLIVCQVYKIHNNIAPSYLIDLMPTTVTHPYNTRNKSLSKPSVKTFGKNSFSFRACSAWNGLPLSVRNKTTLNTFKLYCKKHFMSSMKRNELNMFLYY